MLYRQTALPGAERDSNWLPAPRGDFIPMLRMYWPKETPPSIPDGIWKPPGVKRLE
jgi:hypothetical protein